MTDNQKTNKARIMAALDKKKAEDAAKRKEMVNGTKPAMCPVCGGWARTTPTDWKAPDHPDCPHANRDAGKKKHRPTQAERRQKRIDQFVRLPDGSHMEQTYLAGRGWILKLTVPIVQGPGVEAPWNVEFHHTGPDHLPAIEAIYLKYRDWLKAQPTEATK
jgi:hypothetical protein